MTTKILGTQIEAGTIQTEQLANNFTAAFANSSQLSALATTTALSNYATQFGPKVSSVAIANSSFIVLDDTAVNVGGGHIVVTGNNFQSGATVLIDTTPASSVSIINSNRLHVQVPARPAATYNLYVVNPDGGTGIRVNALTYSGTPTWVTTSPLTQRTRNNSINFNLSATGATSYTLAAGSSLPPGTALLANGYFYGVPTGAETDTVYTFSIVATDAELQDSSITLSITITSSFPGLLYAFGQSTYGEHGLNNIISRSSPTQIGSNILDNWTGNSAIQRISTVINYSAAIKRNGELWAWGRGTSGQLGNNSNLNRSSPVQVGVDTNWSFVTAGNLQLVAIKTNGTMWNTGSSLITNYNFQTAAFRSSMVQIGTESDWRSAHHPKDSQLTCMWAIKTNGTLWAWGRNEGAALGLNDVIQRSSPVQIGTDTWSKLNEIGNGASSGVAVLAIKTNGTLWGWGQNNNGNLGVNDRIDRSSPVQVGTDTWIDVAPTFGDTAAVGIKTTGTLWSWGGNTYGTLGIGNATLTNRRSSPVQVGALTNWKSVAAHNQACYAIKTDGTLWAWGNGNYGQLGDTVTQTGSQVTSPKQIGALTRWTTVVSRRFGAIAVLESDI